MCYDIKKVSVPVPILPVKKSFFGAARGVCPFTEEDKLNTFD